MANRFVLARDGRTGNVVHISDVEEGYPHAFCDDCEASLVAANRRQDTRKVASYFRHQGGGEGCSSMTMLHAYAQQVVRDHGFIQLPNFHTTVSPQNAKSANESLPVQRPGYLAALKDASLERGYPTRPRLIADVHGIEPDVGSLYVEIRVHHEVDDSKIAALKNAGLDVIEVDLRSLVDQPGLTKEHIVEAVVSSAGREWISQQRFERDIRAAREKMQRLEEADAQERRLARAAREACGATKKQWRAEHQDELGLISAYAELENRERALDKLWDWCHHPRRPENRVFTRLIDQFGEVPQAVNLPVRGELAFKVHRLYWQTLIFEGVILRSFDNQVKRIAQYKRKNRRFFYGEEIAWLSDTPEISPVCVFQTKVATDSRRSLPPIPRESCH